MVRTLRTHLEVVLEDFGLQDFPTIHALNPQAFRDFGSALGHLTLKPRSL
jgi:hypothetical protein